MRIGRVVGVLLLLFWYLFGGTLETFECEDRYIYTSRHDQKMEGFGAKVISSSLNIELDGVSYNVLDNLIYALVTDPAGLKGWSRYDIVKIGKNGTILNLGTPTFKNGTNIYDAFRVKNGVIDSFGYYYSVGDPISLDTLHSKRAILYIVYLGKNPKAGTLVFDKKELQFLNLEEWTPPKDLTYLNSTQKIYGFGDKRLFEIDPKKYTLKEIKVENATLLNQARVSNIWSDSQNRLFIYALWDKKGKIFEVKLEKNDQASLKEIEELKAYENIDITNCIYPSFSQTPLSSQVEVGKSFEYLFEIQNPFPYSIRVKFVSKLPDGVSFDDSLPPKISSKDFYFSPSEIRVNTLLIPKLSKSSFKLKVNVDDSINKKISGKSYIEFRGIKYYSEDDSTVNIYVKNPSLKLKEKLLKNFDEDKSGDISVGDTLEFEVVALNNGKVTLEDVRVGDPTISPDSKTCPILEVGQECRLIGKHKVTLKDEKIGEIKTFANASSKNLPLKRVSLKIPVISSSVDLALEFDGKNLDSNTKEILLNLKNNGMSMATNVMVKLDIPKDLFILDVQNSKGEFDIQNRVWKLPFVDAKAKESLKIELGSNQTKEFVISASVKSEDKDRNLANNKATLGVKFFRVEEEKEKVASFQKDASNKRESYKLAYARKEKNFEQSGEFKKSRGGESYKNSIPIAVDDEVTIEAGKKILIDLSKGVLVNDKDLDGDPLKVVKFKIDSNGDGIEEEYQPKDLVNIYGVGEFRLFEDGSFEFNPQEGYDGYFPTVIYFVSDGRGGISSAKLTINIGESLPEIEPASAIKGDYLESTPSTSDGIAGGVLWIFVTIFSNILLFFRRRRVFGTK